MADNESKIQEMKDIVSAFAKERDWEKFHNPKDLGIALSIEVSELMEHFRFKSNEEIQEFLKDAEKKKEISYELADIFHAVLRISEVCNIDLSESLKEKMVEARKKYPVEKVKGKNEKYTHYSK
ncbi:MAG: nucleotide pyrophosphohydrolase [Candidatus Nanoarchaeia archaeon]|nr:nucleotide pyrophosphohydrolase [Candidatus Nanoarchaeia archaeon]